MMVCIVGTMVEQDIYLYKHKKINMNITEHLKKDYWLRRVTPDRIGFVPSVSHDDYKMPSQENMGHATLKLTQENLMDEITPTAHKIFSEYLSKRPVYKPTGKKDELGKDIWEIDGYDEVEQVALAMQWRMAMSKTSHFAADGFWTADESPNGGKKDQYDKFKSWMDCVGLNTAFMEIVWSCFSTGDAGIYIYQRGKDIEYKVFSKWNGYTLYPDIDENGNEVVWVKYMLKGKKAVDYYGVDKIETWVALDDDKTWWDKVKGLFKSDSTRIKSEDGYTRIAVKDTQVGNDMSQFVYFRVNDIPSGIVETLIQSLEKTCSYVAEEVKSSAFPVLFLKSGVVTSLPPMDANGKIIGVKGDVEMLKASDAKFLTPPDASNIATLHIQTLRDEIYHASQSVIIDPEVLKSGADSSATMKILFTPEIQWCQVMWFQFFHPLRRMVEIFKRLVGKVEMQGEEFDKLRISIGQKIWIPQNRAEEVDTTMKMVYGRVISRMSAISELGLGYVGDYDQIQKEWENELQIKAEIPAKVKSEYETTEVIDVIEESNPTKEGVDNNARGKSISE